MRKKTIQIVFSMLKVCFSVMLIQLIFLFCSCDTREVDRSLSLGETGVVKGSYSVIFTDFDCSITEDIFSFSVEMNFSVEKSYQFQKERFECYYDQRYNLNLEKTLENNDFNIFEENSNDIFLYKLYYDIPMNKEWNEGFNLYHLYDDETNAYVTAVKFFVDGLEYKITFDQFYTKLHSN